MEYQEVFSGFGSNANTPNLAFGKFKVWKL
jgi:hypothetical protein